MLVWNRCSYITANWSRRHRRPWYLRKRCKELGFTACFDYSWQWACRNSKKQVGLCSSSWPRCSMSFLLCSLLFWWNHYIDIWAVMVVTDLSDTTNQKSIASFCASSYWKMENGVDRNISISDTISLKLDKEPYLITMKGIESLAKNILDPFVSLWLLVIIRQRTKCLENVETPSCGYH